MNVTITRLQYPLQGAERILLTEVLKMDVKKPSVAQSNATNRANLESVRQKSQAGNTAAQQSQATDTTTPDKGTVDAGATLSLVELGREEAKALHERMITRLRDDIASGTYSPDMDVVSERVAEVLGD